MFNYLFHIFTIYFLVIILVKKHDALETNCVPIPNCPYYYELLKEKPIPVENRRLIREAHCGFDGLTPKVVCEDPDFEESTTIKITTTTIDSGSVIPPQENDKYSIPGNVEENDVCGRTDSQPNRVFGGEATDIDEHPWNVLLLYERWDGAIVSRCGGVLISNKHVLTAAHCIQPKLKAALLGEYNTLTDIDCIKYYGDKDCADPAIQIPVESAIPHPKFYNPGEGRRPFYDDIGIITLKHKVNFTDFIKPICLPTPGQNYAKNTTFIVTGWGKTEKGKRSSVKLKAPLPLVESRNCSTLLVREIRKTQICAGGQKGVDACIGDSGGPLMYYDLKRDFWTLAGIVSLGTEGCGKKDIPGIYTSVSEYTDWIKTT